MWVNSPTCEGKASSCYSSFDVFDASFTVAAECSSTARRFRAHRGAGGHVSATIYPGCDVVSMS